MGDKKQNRKVKTAYNNAQYQAYKPTVKSKKKREHNLDLPDFPKMDKDEIKKYFEKYYEDKYPKVEKNEK